MKVRDQIVSLKYYQYNISPSYRVDMAKFALH